MDRQFFFLSNTRNSMFVRTDAISAVVVDHEDLLKMTFPLNAGRRIEQGMEVIFMDDGEPNVYEVRNVRTSITTDTETVEAESIGLAELRDHIVESINVKKVSFQSVVQEILDGTGWEFGTYPDDLPESEYSYYKWTINTGSSLNLVLRKSPSTSSTSLGSYANGTQVEQTGNTTTSGGRTWMPVKTPDGKTGYMSASSLTNRKTYTVAGLPMITLQQDYSDAYSLLVEVLDKVELMPSFRVELDANKKLTRYVDMVYQQQAEYNGARIEIDRNVLSDDIEYDDRSLYTAVYATGKDGLTFKNVVWSEDNGNPANKPSGQAYVEDVNATSVFGRDGVKRSAHIEISDEDNASDLLNAAWAWLQQNNTPKLSLTMKVVDLARLGFTGQKLQLSEIVNVVIQPIGTTIQASVVELKRDLLNPENTTPTIGNYQNTVMSNIVQNTMRIEEVKNEQDIKIDEIASKIPNIQYGLLSLSSNSGAAVTRTITFSPAFSSTPRLLCTPLTSTAAGMGYGIFIHIVSISTSSASVRLTSNYSGSLSIGAYWLAIGD